MKTRENILSTLQHYKADLSLLGVKYIGLFGSYARNEQSEQSDIDILIEFAQGKESYDNLMAVYDLIEQMFQDEKVEVVTKNGLSPYIGSSILNEVLNV